MAKNYFAKLTMEIENDLPNYELVLAQNDEQIEQIEQIDEEGILTDGEEENSREAEVLIQ